MTSVTAAGKTAVLDVGCGRHKISNAMGIDRCKFPEVDVVHDLDQYPWPFEDNAFDRVICRHSLAHLYSVEAAMEELYRLTKPAGIVEILTPHFSSDNAFTDITSRCFFGYRSMDYFCVNRPMKYKYGSCRFVLKEVRISFLDAYTFDGQHRRFNPFAILGLEWLINRFPRSYEHFVSSILRANEVYYRLEVLKQC